jgi:hypothetical protein
MWIVVRHPVWDPEVTSHVNKYGGVVNELSIPYRLIDIQMTFSYTQLI